MQQYREYKDSGIEWIGKIPVGWDIHRLKKLIEKHQIGIWGGEPNDKDNNIICVRIADFNFEKFSIESNEYTVRSYTSDQITRFKLPQNTILIEKSGGGENSPVGRVVMFDHNCPAVCANFIEAITPMHTLYPKFLLYFFITAYYAGINKKYIKQTTGIQNLDIERYLYEQIALPPLPEQEAIAAYLDEKTTHIDSAIANLQLQAEKLSAYKRQLIAKTVRRGLNETVTYKDSGIEWIGKIPAGWEVVPLKTVAKDNRTRNIGMQCNVLLSLSYGNIITKDINSSFGLIPENFETYQIVNPGYIVLRLTDMQNDKRSLRSGYVTHRGIITSAYIGLIPMDNINNKYLSYVLHVYDLKKVYYALGSGLRQSIKYVDIKNLPILQPPLPEQEAIAAYLDKKITLIASITADIQRQIEQLKNYRKIIIHDAVTGRIKVPENAQ